MKFINLTPLALTCVGGRYVQTFPPSGGVARVINSPGVSSFVDGMPVEEAGTSLSIDGLPCPQEGVILLVSAQVRQALPLRTDLYSPGELFRDDQGQPIGCRGWIRNPFSRDATGFSEAESTI
jgi:hypothetical protein